MVNSLADHALLQSSEHKHFLLQTVVAVKSPTSFLEACCFGQWQDILTPLLPVSSYRNECSQQGWLRFFHPAVFCCTWWSQNCFTLAFKHPVYVALSGFRESGGSPGNL